MSSNESAIRSQYELFPYPVRDPDDERERLAKTILDGLPLINHFVFGGALERSRALRVLVAGGGTGDALIYLAQQLHDARVSAEITYLDLSSASRQIAEARAQVRGLKDIRFLTGSLLDLDRVVPGEFDYINCTGVLHHLQDPLQGLRTLAARLSPDGGMGVMLYAQLGRTGIYPVQRILRAIAPQGHPPEERIRIARKLIEHLPENHWLKRNPAIPEEEWRTDADLFDLLLNSQDVAYDVQGAERLARSAGLRIASFMPPALYEPSTYLKDEELLQRMSHMGGIERAAMAEDIAGTLNKLVFFAVRADNPVRLPDPMDLAFVPILNAFPPLPEPEGNHVSIPLRGPYFFGTASLTPAMAEIVRRIDSRRRLDDIRAELGLGPEEFKGTLSSFYPWMHGFNYIVLSRSAWP